MNELSTKRPEGLGGHLRLWTTLVAAVVFLVPFALFFYAVELDVGLRRVLLLCALPCVVAGMGMAVAAGNYAVHYLERVTAQMQKALALAQYRERERDLAQDELVRRLQEERELAREKMQFDMQLSAYEKYAALAQLALGAAHEINNPLLGILSHLELELKDTTDADAREEIEQCIAGTKRISSTIRGLINYARPGPLLLSKISLERLVDETFSFLRHQPMFRGIELQKEIAPDLPDISADANQLSQVLMNLLLNAAEATPEGGSITIVADKVKFEQSITVRVSDTGCGIPADILPHVLEPFFTTKRGKGTGLGLSISHAYVRSHGGEIHVESLPGRGTTVRFTLPIRQEGRTVSETEEVVA